jgi:tRNA A37 methylthiotransferase MiaB
VFDYSDEDGTEAAGLPAKVSATTIKRRYEKIAALADELCAQRAEERVGSSVEVLVESVGATVEGRAAHQAPEVDGSTTLREGDGVPLSGLRPGDLVRATVTASEGVDLVAVVHEVIPASPR